MRKARRDKIAEEEFGKSKMMEALENREKMLLKEHEVVDFETALRGKERICVIEHGTCVNLISRNFLLL